MIIPYELPDPSSHNNVLIFPGGGYNHVSLQKEGADVAAAFNQNGFNAYVLEYRVEPFTGKDFLQDAVDAMRTVRQIIGKNGAPGRKLALMGFSAGGHLALTETEHWQDVIGDPATAPRTERKRRKARRLRRSPQTRPERKPRQLQARPARRMTR